MLYKQRAKRYLCFISAMLLIAPVISGLLLQTKIYAAPPLTVELTGYNSREGKNTLITCKLKAGTVSHDKLTRFVSNDTYTGADDGRYRNYNTSEKNGEISGAAGYQNLFDEYSDLWGDRDGSPSINYISAVSIDGNAEKDYICSSTLLYLQDPINTNFFYGLLVTDEENDKGCTASLSVSDFASGTAKIGSLWRAPATDCSNTPDYSNISMNIEGLTSDFKNGTVGGGGTGTGGELHFSQATDFRWVDLETIQSGVMVVRGGFRPIETYKWDSFWGSDDDQNDIYYRLIDDPATPLSEERAKLLDGRSDGDTNKSCIPHIQFTQDGGSGNDNKLDINLDNSDKNYQGDFRSIADVLKKSSVQGHFYDKSPVGGSCSSPSDANPKENINIVSTNLKLWFEYYPGTGAQLMFNNVLNREQEFNHRYILDETDNSILTMESQTCETAKTQLRLASGIADAAVNEVVGGEWQVAFGCEANTEATYSIPILVRVMAGTPPELPSPETTIDPEATDESCEGSTINDGFGWITCWVLRGIDNGLQVAEDTIQGQLEVRTDTFNNESLHSAWTQIARISSGLLAIVALVMVISTALGYSAFDAYTVKKILPRIVIAAIGIWLSWGLVTTYINIMNDIGRGIAGLMFSPFGENYGVSYKDVTLQSLIGPEAVSGGGTGAFANLTVIGGLVLILGGSGGIFAVLAALMPVLAFILIGFLVLVLRQAIIVFLLVLAPLGFAAWILPNTEKVWKLWSGTLNKLLIMFPMFMGVFAAAKIFAIISQDANSTAQGVDSYTGVLIPALAYISPFIFLPALFKAAGGLLGNLTGMVNDKSKGLFDKAKGGLDKRAKLTNRNLAKVSRDQIRSQNRQFGLARSIQKGGLRSGLYGGFRSSKMRRAMQTKAVGLSEAEADKNLKEAEAQLKQEAAYSEMGDLETIALDKSQSTARRQAALNRLSQRSQTARLTNIQRQLGTRGGQEGALWNRFQRTSSDLYDFAPHLSTDGATPDVGAFNRASPEKALKWNPETWKAAMASNPDRARALATAIHADPQLWRQIGGNYDTIAAPTGTPPAGTEYAGNRDFFGRHWGLS